MKKLLLTIMILTSTSQALASRMLFTATDSVIILTEDVTDISSDFGLSNEDPLRHESSFVLANADFFAEELELSSELRFFVERIKKLNDDLFLSDRDVLEAIVIS